MQGLWQAPRSWRLASAAPTVGSHHLGGGGVPTLRRTHFGSVLHSMRNSNKPYRPRREQIFRRELQPSPRIWDPGANKSALGAHEKWTPVLLTRGYPSRQSPPSMPGLRSSRNNFGAPEKFPSGSDPGSVQKHFCVPKNFPCGVGQTASGECLDFLTPSPLDPESVGVNAVLTMPAIFGNACRSA